MSEEGRRQPFDVTALPVQRAGDVVEVLSDAFFSYPVMKYVLGSRSDYEADLRALVEFFVMARFLRDDLVLGATGRDGALAGVATITLPVERDSPDELTRIREDVWNRLGDDDKKDMIDRVYTLARRHAREQVKQQYGQNIIQRYYAEIGVQ